MRQRWLRQIQRKGESNNMKKLLVFQAVVMLLLAACGGAPPPPVAEPTAHPTTVSTPTPVPTPEASQPAETPLGDRAIFHQGLIDAEQAAVDQLQDATEYHIDLQISDDLIHLQGKQEVRYSNRENEPLNEIYFRLYPNLVGGEATV